MAQEKISQKTNSQELLNLGSKTYNLVTSALLIALVFIFTKFVQFPLPGSAGGGLVHMGNVMVFTAAIVFGPKKGFIAAAFGMALFDILSPYAAYAPITFLGKGAMAYVAGTLAYMSGKNGFSLIYNSVGIILGGFLMILVYYLGEVIMYNNFYSPLSNIPGNITQIVIGYVIGIPLIFTLKKYKYFSKLYTA